MVRVMATKTRDPGVPLGYDPSQFPAFAVTVDVVVLTMSEGLPHVLLVCRGEAPFEGMWAILGGFKRPTETLDEAAKRELVEETGVDAASLLTQFGAYGDPERDRSEEHTSELQSQSNLVCRLLLEKKKK